MAGHANKLEKTTIDFDLLKLICDENVNYENFNEDVYVNAPSLENIIYPEQSDLQNVNFSESEFGFKSINLESLSLDSGPLETINNCSPSTFIENNSQFNSNKTSVFLLRKDPLGAIVRVPVSTSHNTDSSSSPLTVEEPEDVTFADHSTKAKLQLAILSRRIAEGKDITNIFQESPKIETMPSQTEVAKEKDRKERNRLSAKKSRESKKAEYDDLKKKNKILTQINEHKKKAVETLGKKAKTLKDFIHTIESQESHVKNKALEEFSNTYNLHPHINQESGDETYMDIGLPTKTILCDKSTEFCQDQRNSTSCIIRNYLLDDSLSTYSQQDISLNEISYENMIQDPKGLSNFTTTIFEESQSFIHLGAENQEQLFPHHNHQNTECEIPVHQEPQQLPSQTAGNVCGNSTQLPVSDNGYLSQLPVSDNGYLTQLPVSDSGYLSQLPVSDSGYLSQLPVSDSGFLSQLLVSDSVYLSQVTISDSIYTTQLTDSDNGYSTQVAVSGFRDATQIAVSGSPCCQSLTSSDQGNRILITSDLDIQMNDTKQVSNGSAYITKHLKNFDAKNTLGVWLVDSSGSDDELINLTKSFIEEPTVKKMKLDGNT